MNVNEEPVQAPDEDIDPYRARLIEGAINWHTNWPHVRVIGIVLAPDAANGVPGLRHRMGNVEFTGEWTVVTIPRVFAVDVLEEVAPQAIDWLVDDADGPRRRLPVVHLSARGVRVIEVFYDSPRD